LGAVYIRHDGFGPDTARGLNVPPGINALGQPDPGSFGKPLNQNINFFYAGGALFLMQYFTDILFEPLVAQQKLNAAHWQIQTAKNAALLQTAKAYGPVHTYRGQSAAPLSPVGRGRKLVEMVEALSRALVRGVEGAGGRPLVAALEQAAAAARRNWR